jgi:hypothetical protein
LGADGRRFDPGRPDHHNSRYGRASRRFSRSLTTDALSPEDTGADTWNAQENNCAAFERYGCHRFRTVAVRRSVGLRSSAGRAGPSSQDRCRSPRRRAVGGTEQARHVVGGQLASTSPPLRANRVGSGRTTSRSSRPRRLQRQRPAPRPRKRPPASSLPQPRQRQPRLAQQLRSNSHGTVVRRER